MRITESAHCCRSAFADVDGDDRGDVRVGRLVEDLALVSVSTGVPAAASGSARRNAPNDLGATATRAKPVGGANRCSSVSTDLGRSGEASANHGCARATGAAEGVDAAGAVGLVGGATETGAGSASAREQPRARASITARGKRTVAGERTTPIMDSSSRWTDELPEAWTPSYRLMESGTPASS